MSGKPKIAVIQFYFYPDISAVSQLLGDLLAGLAETKRFDLTVFCGTSTYEKKRLRENRVARLPGIKIRRIKTSNLGRTSFLTRVIDYVSYYAFIFSYFFFSKKWDAIVCMTSPPLIGFAVAMATMMRRSPIIYYIQDLYPEILFDMGYIQKPWLVRKLMGINRIIIRKAFRVITIGSYMEKKLRHYYRNCSAKIRTISNWADRGVSEWREKSNRGEFVLLYSGNMGLAHEFTHLPEFIRRLKAIDGIRYRFIGGGKKRDELVRIFKDTRELRSEFVGYAPRSDVDRNLSQADVLIIAQKEETVGDILPSKFFSYLSVGRPLLFLGPKESEIGEVVLKNDIGAVVESERDVDSAVRYVTRLIKNPTLVDLVGRRAYKLYNDRYRFRHSLQAFENTLAEVAGNRK